MIDPAVRQQLLARLPQMTADEMAQTLALIEELEQRKRVQLAQDDFLAFIAMVEPAYKFGVHLKRLGGLLMQVETGEKDRVAVSMAPRFGKSTMISIYYPAWYLGKHPDHKLIIASHTGDLAVDMARKVRNLMQSSAYKAIFPGVSISADAKAAGKWSTVQGGEVYAVGVGGAIAGRGAHLCVTPATRVHTLERGLVAACTVQLGEHLRSWHGWAPVRATLRTTHIATVTLHGSLQVSTTHPIWTATRGWVAAAQLQPDDVLWTTCLWDKLRILLYGALHVSHTRTIPHAHVQHMGDDAAAMYQPQRGQLCAVRCAWHNSVRAVARVCQFLRRYGRPADAPAHPGSDRPERQLHTTELPLGGCRDATKQPIQRGADTRVRASSVCPSVGTQDGADRRYDHASHTGATHAPRAGIDHASDESSQAPARTHPAGWYRRTVLRLLGYRRTSTGYWQLRGCKESHLERLGRQIADRCWFLLGVRRAGCVDVYEHAPRNFVNFTVGGDNTFIADQVLTHNCVVDDPISEQDVKSGNTDLLDSVYEYFRSGLRTRLMPGGRVCVLHTRWHTRDLIGRLLKDGAMNPGADQYEMFEFPALLTVKNPAYTPDAPDFDPETPATIEKSLWPEQWSLESLQRTRASMVLWQWNAQYQQNPTAAESALVTRAQCRRWPHAKPPEVDFVVQAYDTALTTKARSDYSVCQTWGVWRDDNDVDNVILLNCVRGRWEFPELKRMAHEQAADWEPDSVIVETKASGQPLVDEMRRSGIFVQEFSPGKGQDKIARLNAIVDMFASGQVWFPETQWADEVIEELVTFPVGEHDDCVDACTLALMRVRQGGLVRLVSDVHDDTRVSLPRRAAYY